MGMIRFHKEGRWWIGGSLIGGILLIALYVGLREPLWLWLPLIGGWGVWTGLVLNFFRYPRRECPADPSLLYAPCDGKVVEVKRTFEPKYFHTEMRQISIFMSPLNVHVNWAPAEGQVMHFQHNPGLYKVAWHPKASLLNEQTFIAVQTQGEKQYALRQIAGTVARRIRTYCRVGDTLRPGQEIGFIKFGSRVDVLLPLSAEILVQPGMLVQGPITPIARW